MAKDKSQAGKSGTGSGNGGRDALDGMARERLADALKAWEEGELAEFMARQPEAKAEYGTASGLPLKRLYTAL
ncbi:MAG: hypothetical protein ACE5GT_12510, partial [Rhodospirillales bacterium]